MSAPHTLTWETLAVGRPTEPYRLWVVVHRLPNLLNAGRELTPVPTNLKPGWSALSPVATPRLAKLKYPPNIRSRKWQKTPLTAPDLLPHGVAGWRTWSTPEKRFSVVPPPRLFRPLYMTLQGPRWSARTVTWKVRHRVTQLLPLSTQQLSRILSQVLIILHMSAAYPPLPLL